MIVWFILAGCTPDQTFLRSNISTVRTTVNVVGTPMLDRPNGDWFTLEEVYATLYSVRFLECETTAGVYSVLPLNSADAGHSDIAIPTNWNRPSYIDILNPHTIQTEIVLEPQSICSGAVTWARWDGGTFDLPPVEPEETFSMLLRGSCTDAEGEERLFEVLTAVPSEKIDTPTELDGNGPVNTLNFTVVFDTTELLHKIECSDDLLDNSSSSALQALFNIQNNSEWGWEWE